MIAIAFLSCIAIDILLLYKATSLISLEIFGGQVVAFFSFYSLARNILRIRLATAWEKSKQVEPAQN
jgi:uncharacterized membrane protein